jgi:hypothetical protein
MTRAAHILYTIDEVSPEKVLRYWLSSKKKVHRKLDCPPGFVLTGTSCKKLSAQEVRKLKRAARKRLRKLRGKQRQIMRKRLRALVRRKSLAVS